MFATQINILLEFNKIKTVNDKVIITVIKQLLSRHYHSNDGSITWSKDHEVLFKEIDEKIKKILSGEDEPESVQIN